MSGDRDTIWVQGVAMTIEHYRQRLLVEQHRAFTRLERAVAGVSDPGDGAPHDTGDESSSGALRYQQLAQAEAARTLLNQVRDALDRIENGTFGTCAEDGEPIEEARLEAVPWVAHCHRHDRRRSPTL
jgi:DnaK suppressor protein